MLDKHTGLLPRFSLSSQKWEINIFDSFLPVRFQQGMITYDLLIIGSGPAGQRAAIYATISWASALRLWSAMRTIGGVSINTGTIPSKTMREAVLHLSGYNYRSIYGMNYKVKEKITMADLAFRVQHVIKTEIDVTEAQLSRNGIDVLPGVASFEDATHVKVTNEGGTQTYEAKNIIIATGTKPADSAPRAYQRALHRQQRSDPRPAQPAQVAHRGGWGRHWRGIHLYVRRARRTCHPHRKAA